MMQVLFILLCGFALAIAYGLGVSRAPKFVHVSDPLDAAVMASLRDSLAQAAWERDVLAKASGRSLMTQSEYDVLARRYDTRSLPFHIALPADHA